MLSRGGLSADQVVFGSNPADLSSWQDGDDAWQVAYTTSISGQFVQQWESRTMARGADLKEIANSKLGRVSARKQSFVHADVKVEDSALL